MPDSNAMPTQPSHASTADDHSSGDVFRQMIDLCWRELEATAQALEYASAQGDADRAAAAVLDIQAIALLHGIDEVAILATEAEHATELNDDCPTTWQTMARRLIDACRRPPHPSGQAA